MCSARRRAGCPATTRSSRPGRPRLPPGYAPPCCRRRAGWLASIVENPFRASAGQGGARNCRPGCVSSPYDTSWAHGYLPARINKSRLTPTRARTRPDTTVGRRRSASVHEHTRTRYRKCGWRRASAYSAARADRSAAHAHAVAYQGASPPSIARRVSCSHAAARRHDSSTRASRSVVRRSSVLPVVAAGFRELERVQTVFLRTERTVELGLAAAVVPAVDPLVDATTDPQPLDLEPGPRGLAHRVHPSPAPALCLSSR